MTHSPIVAFRRYMTSRQVFVGRLMPVLLGALALGSAGAAALAANTSTTLTVTTNPTPATSGQVVTLTANVTINGNGGGTPAGGTVTFTDTYNNGSGGNVQEVLGTVQVQSANGTQGTAILATEIGGNGNHHFNATYNGTSTPDLRSSSSGNKNVAFSGLYSSATSLAVTGTGAPYTLTGTVSGFGPKIPTGTVTFTDITTSATLGTATLTSTPASQFTPFQSYPLANLNDGNTGGTIGPAIGDFNGDGRPDYAVPVNSGSVAILLGKGDGTFTTGTAVATTSPFEPTSVVVGDFNGDGNQDLAVLSANGIGSVNIYLGHGDGTFGTATNFKVATTNSGSRLLAVGDFDEDGIQDLVATNTSLNNVAVLLGKGDGTFKTAVSYSTNASGNLGQQPWNVVVGDLDGDGHLDLAVASDNAGSITILLGNGDGTFQTATYVDSGAQQVGSVAVADFDGDGKLDLATTSAPDNAVYVLLNTTSRRNGFSFGTATKNTMNSGPYYLTIGDFDRDGNPDIISANNGSNNVGVLIGNGNGTFATAAYYGVGAGSIFANVGDINGDNRVDLTAVTSNGLSVLLSGQAETATLSNVTVAGCSVQSLVATYGGDGNYGTSTSPSVNITNAALATTLTLGVAPAGAAAGQQISLQATLAPYSQGSTTSNGDLVSFYNGATLLGTAPLSSGVAVFNYVLPSGPFSFQAKFPGDCSFVKSNSNTVSGTSLLASTLTWANPAPIPVGTPLTNTQLNATDSVPGTFVYTPAKNTVLPAGTQTLSVTFTPTSPLYGVQTATVQIVVQPATSIIWPTPTPITYGTPLTGFQLDATASTGTTSVPLASYYNVSGIYSTGSVYNTGGFDNDGYSYSTTSLGGTVVWNGLTFAIGPPNAPDAVATPNTDPSCRGDNCARGPALVIPLPAGNFTNLYMLGAMVNNTTASQTFIVTYTDNSTLTFTQNMSDWFNVKGWAGESVINCSEDRNFSDGTNHSIQPDSACLFGYQIPLDSTKTVKSVQLPATRDIVMLSMDLTTPSIPGTFTYTPPAGTIEPVGTDTLSVVFTPTDTTHYQSASASVQLLVYPPPTPIVTTTINWPTPAPITYGTPLSATQLDATAMGSARPTPVTPISQLSVISTSTDGTQYNQPGFDNAGLTYSYKLLNNGKVNYAGTTFTLGQPNVPNAITNGAVYSLGAAQGSYSNVYLIGAAIAAQANVPFVLTYSDASTTTISVNMSAWTASAGNAGETVIAKTTYANNQAGNNSSGNYYLYGYQLPVNAGKTLVSVTLPSTRNVVIMALGFGTNNTVVVPGTYTYTPPAGTTTEPVGTDTLSVSFVPTNTAGYTSATGTTQLTVIKATPVITWPTPTPINVNVPLSGTQLDATAATPEGANLPGTFVYSPAAGVSFSTPGIYPLNVTFTPTNTTDYTTATATVNLTVGRDVAVSSGVIAYTDCCFFSQPTPYTITVAGDATFFGFPIPPTGSVSVIYNGTLLATGSLSVQSGSTSTATVLLPSIQFVPGNNNVTIQYSGDSFFYGVTNTPATIVLRDPAIPVTPAAVNQTVVTSIPYRFVQDATLTFSYTPHGGASSEFTDGAGTGDCINNHQYNAKDECTFNVAFKPTAPGIRKGVIQVNFAPRNGAQIEPILYLFLSGKGNASQMTLANGKQKTLNAGLNQPQGVAFNPLDSLLYVSNSNASQIVTLPLSGGAFTRWNAAHTGNLVYPTDLSYDAFADLLVADANSPQVFSFSPLLAESVVSTVPITLGLPTANRVDLGGNLYIADGGNTPQVVMVPGEIWDTDYKPSVLLNSSSVSFPQALGVDNAGANLYVGDGINNQVVKVALNGTNTTSQLSLSPCDALVTPCAFNGPSGFAFDPNGDMYLIDATRLLMVPANHSVSSPTLLMPLTGLLGASAVSLDGSGNIYVTDVIGSVYELAANAGTMSITGVGGSQKTTLTNTGNVPLTFSPTAVTFVSGGSNFTETDTCAGNTIAAGASCTITVTSKAAGSPSATLSIVSNALPTNTATIQIN
jgi:FG-GAP-like repeat